MRQAASGSVADRDRFFLGRRAGLRPGNNLLLPLEHLIVRHQVPFHIVCEFVGRILS